MQHLTINLWGLNCRQQRLQPRQYFCISKTLPKAQRTRGLSSSYQGSSKFKQVQTQILVNFHLQNLNQALTSKSQPNISNSTKFKVNILTKPSFRILTKIQLRNNLNQTSAAKYWPNLRFKILPELLTPDKILCWKSEQKSFAWQS